MASVIGRGYNPSGVSSGNSVISDSPAQIAYGSVASGLAKVAGADASLLGDIIRESSGISSRNSALSQAFAREQMDFQEESSRYAMNWSAEEAAKNREWQERLSNTAHQREVEDLMSAGLNPILSANHGAMTGSGSTGQAFQSAGSMGSVDTTNPINLLQGFFSDILNSAMSMKMHTDQMDLEKSRINANERIAKTSADANMASAGMAASASMYASDKNFEASQLRNEAERLMHASSIEANKAEGRRSREWQSGENALNRESQEWQNERNHGRTATGFLREATEGLSQLLGSNLPSYYNKRYGR